jgi:hypothetical protein
MAVIFGRFERFAEPARLVTSRTSCLAGRRADRDARRVGGAARPRDCRALRAALAWGGGLCAAGGRARGHPRFPRPPSATHPHQPSYAHALRFCIKSARSPWAAAAPDPHPLVLFSDNCNTNTTDSWSSLGNIYRNDTRLDGDTVLTGSRNFTVKEIEAFEIAD